MKTLPLPSISPKLFISSQLNFANLRNELMKMGLVIEILAVTLAFGAVVGGVFGMNVVNDLETNPKAFTFILVAMCLLMVVICGGFLLKYYFLKRDTSKAQSYNVLRNFFKYADLLEFEFQKFPEKNIKKEAFIESVTRLVRITVLVWINDKCVGIAGLQE